MAALANRHKAERTYSIRDLTQEYGITARTLRHYETEGLISPLRDGQTRVYTGADRVRLAWILRGRRVGFSLAEIAEMLALYDQAGGPELQRRAALAKCRDRIVQLEAQRADLEATIAELSDFCDQVDRLSYDPSEDRWIDRDTGKVPDTISPFDYPEDTLRTSQFS